MLRLDAVAYLWKQIGTTCIHLPQTHWMVKLMRAVLDIIAPHVLLLTETNVPHNENISYFGRGEDEAQMVYNFTLPPLLLHTFVRNNADALTRWATDHLQLNAATNTFLNFTASHDGIGVRPLEGILAPEDIQTVIEAVKISGGQVSYRQNSDGTLSPYELNITFVDAMSDKDPAVHVQKFMASQAIQYALPGVPASYIHSLIGSRNWQEGFHRTGRARTINRQPLAVDDVITELKHAGSFRARIFSAYMKLIDMRTSHGAFHPKAPFKILSLSPDLFAIKRWNDQHAVLALTNVTRDDIRADLSALAPPTMTDLISGEKMPTDPLCLRPYQYVWLLKSDD